MDNEELLILLKDMFEKKTDELTDRFDKKTDELADMFEKKTNEIKTFTEEKINNQSVLIESLRSDIKAVAEGHDVLNRKIDSLDKKVDEKFNELKSEIKIVSNYVIGVDAKLNEHEVILKRVK